MKIFYKSNNRLSQYEAENKGYRENVIVNFNNLYYRVNIYDNVRIIQDFQLEIKDCSFFDIPNNLILVKCVTNENIVHTISNLIESGYFENLLPIDVNIKEYQEVFSC